MMDSGSEEELPDIIGPLEVLYCGNCGFPPEFCEFGGKGWKKKCGPWLIENMPRPFLERYELVSAEDELVEGMEAVAVEGNVTTDEEASRAKQTTKKGEKLQKGDKLLPGGKVKKGGESTCVTVEKVTRNKRKFTTVVVGLEHFGVKLKDASKLFKKKFSCGCAVVKGDAGKSDSVEIQGDFQDDVLEMIAEHKDFEDVPEEVLYIKDGTRKRAWLQ